MPIGKRWKIYNKPVNSTLSSSAIEPYISGDKANMDEIIVSPETPRGLYPPLINRCLILVCNRSMADLDTCALLGL